MTASENLRALVIREQRAEIHRLKAVIKGLARRLGEATDEMERLGEENESLRALPADIVSVDFRDATHRVPVRSWQTDLAEDR